MRGKIRLAVLFAQLLSVLDAIFDDWCEDGGITLQKHLILLGLD